MAVYHADVRLEDADGGSWSDDVDFQAENDAAAEQYATEHAENWFEDGETLDGRTVKGATKARVALTDKSGDVLVMEMDLRADGGNTGFLYRER